MKYYNTIYGNVAYVEEGSDEAFDIDADETIPADFLNYDEELVEGSNGLELKDNTLIKLKLARKAVRAIPNSPHQLELIDQLKKLSW